MDHDTEHGGTPADPSLLNGQIDDASAPVVRIVADPDTATPGDPPSQNPVPPVNGVEKSYRASPEEADRKYCKDVYIPKKSHTATDAAKNSGLAAVLTRTDKLWDGMIIIIKYAFGPGPYNGTTAQHSKVAAAIEEWTWYANVQFEEVTSGAHVRITFNPKRDEGSWSLVGKDCLDADDSKATMNFGWIDEYSNDLTDGERAVILHEFGHVLGMLHEHQSPAGGGVPISRVDAAIKFYGDRDGWDDDTVRKQVIEPYNENDVSSFSQVDRVSIMQYPMPASITGLKYDIGYNFTLSEQDKAYMCVMYPRAGEKSHPKAPEWTFKYALAKTGITREAPGIAAKIMDAYLDAENMEQTAVDPSHIRDLFSTWCADEHKKRADSVAHGVSPPSDTRAPGDRGLNGPAHGDAPPTKRPRTDTDPPAKRPKAEESPIVDVEALSMCSTEVPDQVSSASGTEAGALRGLPDGRAHAVIDKAWIDFDRVKIDPAVANGDSRYKRIIWWTVIPCPESSKNPLNLIGPTEYQIKKLKEAFAEWQKYASVEFREEQNPDPNDDGILCIAFQENEYHTGESVSKITGKRSYTNPWNLIRDPVRNPADPPIKISMCFRGISKDLSEAKRIPTDRVVNARGRPQKVTNMQFDERTLRHEIGHYLGLDHEDVGLYGYCVFNDPEAGKDAQYLAKVRDLRVKMRGTKFDTGSIMDILRPAHLWIPLMESLDAHDVRTLVRTVCNLSKYDQANIMLLHPGEKLTGADGPQLIEDQCVTLSLDATVVTQLQGLAATFNWSGFRHAYLQALDAQTQTWSQYRMQTITALQAYARTKNNALHGQRPALRDDRPQDNPPDPNAGKGLLQLLYENLTKTIGPTGAQILTLQSPTRYLAKEEFQFELNGIYSNFIKPIPVAEAEFRLTDALYDPAAIVSAPNGRSLSTVYNQVINNFVPKYTDADRKVRQERERIRSWLLTEVGEQDPYYKFDYGSAGGGKGDDEATLKALDSSLVTNNAFVRKMSRMEFASQLTQDYYDAQMKWELTRDEMIEDAIASRDPKKLGAVTRKLVHITQSQQGKLAMKYANSVVRGYQHIVREALGHLDVSTAAELLQDAKDAFRTTAYSSLYGASRVYPVLMSPVDWSAALDTGFAPEDLSENPDMIIMMISTKSNSLDVLKRQLAALQSSTDGDAAALRAEVDQKAKALEDAEAALHEKYADSTIELAKIAIAIATDGASAAAEAEVQDVGVLESIAAGRNSSTSVDEELNKGAKQLDPYGTAEDVKNQIVAVQKAQLALQGATSAWNTKRQALARAEATSTKTDQAFLESQISQLNKDLAELNAQLRLAKKARDQSIALARKKADQLSVSDLVSDKPPVSGGGSRWQSINIVTEQKYSHQSTTTESSASASRWNVDFWIGSAGGSTEHESASFAAANNDREVHIEISMKVTLVTVDRSSWFQPQLFDNTKGYMKNNSNMTFSTYPAGSTDQTTPEEVADGFRKSARPQPLPPSLLPTYPVGYILCKDVFIKCSNMVTSSSEAKAHLHDKAQSSGGFLCFSYNQASESTKDTSNATFQMAKDGMIVRIPGPQILGYVQQVVPQDLSGEYKPEQSLGKEFYLPPPANPSLGENNGDHASGADRGAAHGLAAPETTKPLPNFTVKPTNMTIPNRAGGDKGSTKKANASADSAATTEAKDSKDGSKTGHPTASATVNPTEPDKEKSAAPPQQNGIHALDADTILRMVQEKLQTSDGGALRAALEKAVSGA